MTARKKILAVLVPIERVVVVIERAFTLILISGMALFVLAGIVCRILYLTAPWTNEVAQIFLMWLMFVGANLGTYYREHVGVTLLPDSLHGTARAIVVYAAHIGFLVFCVYIIVSGIQLVHIQYQMGGATFSLPVDVPRYMLSAILPVSFLAGTLHLVCELLEMDPANAPRGPSDGPIDPNAVAGNA